MSTPKPKQSTRAKQSTRLAPPASASSSSLYVPKGKDEFSSFMQPNYSQMRGKDDRYNYIKQTAQPDGLSYGAFDDDDDDYETEDIEDEFATSRAPPTSAFNGKHQYTKLFAAIKDLQKHGVKISAPEFVFLGFQSSGKTSAVSQAAKLAVGIIQDGTGSRCPTRFRLIANKKAESKTIRVGGRLCKDEAEMIQICCDIHRQLAQQDTFSNDAIEVRIESRDVPELTFVDLPGLFAGDADEIMNAKRQVDAITSYYLHETNPDGTYKYIPVVVMEPVEREHMTKIGNPVNYVSHLIENAACTNKRSDWQSDALFIVNKFDKVLNVRTAADLLTRIDECCGNGKFEHSTILTMMNAGGENTAAMKDDELQQFILNTPKFEQAKLAEILFKFKKNDDSALEALQAKLEKLAGIGVMNNTLEEKMCMIAKKCLPSLQNQMELALREKEDAIASISKQLRMCDPVKLKTQCIEFGNLFMKYLSELYNGSFMPWMRPELKKCWPAEVSDFFAVLNATNSKMRWSYAIPATTLERLISEKELHDKPKPAQLLAHLRMRLFGTAALRRILNAWICQVEFMSFPDYSDEDIVNISGGFNETIQPSVWGSIRNVVLASIHHLTDAVQYLAEMFRYKLKENADIIFECTLSNKFGQRGVDNAALVQLLQRTLRDYKKEVDNMIDELVDNVEVEQQIAQTLDQKHCEETVLIGKYVRFHLKNKTDPSTIHKSYNYHSSAPRSPPPKDDKNSKEENKEETKEQQPGDDQEAKDKLINNSNGKPLMGDVNKDRFDRHYYAAMNLQEVQPKLDLNATLYDIAVIKRYSYIYWTILKQTMIREIIQKLVNHVMACVTQNDRLANAVHVGVDRRHIQELLNKLVAKTGVDNTLLETWIDQNRTLHIEKSINDLTEDDLKSVYDRFGKGNIDLDKKRRERAQLIAELEQYKRLKTKTLQKIYHIKNGNFDAIPDGDDDDDDDDDVADVVDEHMLADAELMNGDGELEDNDEKAKSNGGPDNA